MSLLYNVKQKHGDRPKLSLASSLAEITNEPRELGTQHFMEVYYKHIHKLCMKRCFKSTFTNMATMRNFEIIPDTINMESVYHNKFFQNIIIIII